MPFETRPFDLGNTLARAAQIQSLQNRNELSKLNLEQTRGINNALATGDTNSLSNFGAQGAKLEAELTKLVREGKQAEFEQGIKLSRLMNKAAVDALNSVDPRQAAHLAVQGLSKINPELGKRLGKVDFLSMSPEQATSELQKVFDETEFSTDPQAVSRIVSGQDVTDQGFAPGTVLEETVNRGQVTDTSVLQRPPSKGLSLEVGPDGTVRFSQGNVDAVDAVEVNRKKINTNAVESANASAALRRNLTGTLPEIEANKGSVGIRGQLGLGLGGVATNILGGLAGDEIARAISGNDQEKIAQVLTRLQTLRAQIIPIVTGERSSRFSEPEREIANRALGVIDQIKGPADLSRAFPQVIGAMKELTVATLENEFEQAAISPAVEFPFDLSNDQGFIELGKMLDAAGFTLEEAIRARDRLIRIQNQ